jgi:hypothetical protein
VRGIDWRPRISASAVSCGKAMRVIRFLTAPPSGIPTS